MSGALEGGGPSGASSGQGASSGPSGASSGPLVPAGLNASIIFVRHGESVLITEGRFQGQLDSPLSRLGVRQAEAVAHRVAHPHDHPVLPIPTCAPIEIVHSPLRRTTQTAERIAGELRGVFRDPVPLRADAGLLEIAQGAWEGLHREEIEQRYAAELAAWREAPVAHVAPGGETLPQVQARVRPALERTLKRLAAAEPPSERGHKGASGYPGVAAADTPWSVLVGHDGVFKVTILTLFGLPLEQFWSFPFAMCGITVVEVRDGRAVLRAHNLTEHLAPLLDERAQKESAERQRSGAL